MKWTRPLVVKGIPSPQDVELGEVGDWSRWLVCVDIPDADEQHIVAWFHRNDILLNGAESSEEAFDKLFGDTDGMSVTSYCLNPDGSPVLVPCTRDEALDAAGWKISRMTSGEIVNMSDPNWQYGVVTEDTLVIVDWESASVYADVGRDVYHRPVNAVGDYDHNGHKGV